MLEINTRAQRFRALVGVANIAADILLPYLAYALLAPTGLPSALRLSVGGTLVAAKAIGGPIHTGEFRWRIALAVALVPTAAMLVCHYRGGGDTTSMVVGAVAAGVIMVGDAVYTRLGRRSSRAVDGFAALVLLEVLVGIAVTAISGDARFVLARSSIYIAVGGLFFLATARGDRPVMKVALKPIHTENDPHRSEIFDRLWDTSAPFRTTYRVLSAALGVVWLADAVLRIVVIYSYPPGQVGQSALTSQLPLVVLMAIYFVVGRTWSKPRSERMIQAELAVRA
ncbi:VC0807 family protein [Nocardia sp. NPDC051030]|uniref:VC0807 family protein n=1 Tax=Nocardia sp. NPDC051030 TaxID=3155162 RepID=UPI003435294C